MKAKMSEQIRVVECPDTAHFSSSETSVAFSFLVAIATNYRREIGGAFSFSHLNRDELSSENKCQMHKRQIGDANGKEWS